MFNKFTVRDQLIAWVDKAIDVQDGAIRGYLAQADPGSGNGRGDADQALGALETQYLATVSAAGAAVGGAASIPGVGTGLAVGLSVAETVAFLDATALFALAGAEVRGCPVSSLSRRRALLLVLMLGDDAVRLIPAAEDGSTDGWGVRLLMLDRHTVDEINRTAEKWLLTRFGPRQGMFIVGRLMPFGIGAAVGAAGNALTAKGVIARLRSAFDGVLVDVPSDAAALDVALDVDRSGADDAVASVTAADLDAPTGKYAGLHAFLQGVGDDVVLPLATLDAVVTGGLPTAARTNPSWWSNDAMATRAPQVKAWAAAGLHVSAVELADEKIRFTRGPAPTTTA